MRSLIWSLLALVVVEILPIEGVEYARGLTRTFATDLIHRVRAVAHFLGFGLARNVPIDLLEARSSLQLEFGDRPWLATAENDTGPRLADHVASEIADRYVGAFARIERALGRVAARPDSQISVWTHAALTQTSRVLILEMQNFGARRRQFIESVAQAITVGGEASALPRLLRRPRGTGLPSFAAPPSERVRTGKPSAP